MYYEYGASIVLEGSQFAKHALVCGNFGHDHDRDHDPYHDHYHDP